MQVSVIGIDLAKRVFQVAAINRAGKVISNRQVSRARLLDTLRGFDTGAVVAMEACGSAHYWGRSFSAMGFTVRLIPAQHVKPFVRVNKTDAGDALAICFASPAVASRAAAYRGRQSAARVRCRVRCHLPHGASVIENPSPRGAGRCR